MRQNGRSFFFFFFFFFLEMDGELGSVWNSSTPKFSWSWVWSGVMELSKSSSTTLVYFVRELHPTPLPVLVELKLFG
jgi:hypothetical protein